MASAFNSNIFFTLRNSSLIPAVMITLLLSFSPAKKPVTQRRDLLNESRSFIFTAEDLQTGLLFGIFSRLLRQHG